MDKEAKQHSLSLFTRRQIDVLRLISKGHSNRLIANTLCLSIKSVENYINIIYNIIYSGINASSRGELNSRVNELLTILMHNITDKKITHPLYFRTEEEAVQDSYYITQEEFDQIISTFTFD